MSKIRDWGFVSAEGVVFEEKIGRSDAEVDYNEKVLPLLQVSSALLLFTNCANTDLAKTSETSRSVSR